MVEPGTWWNEVLWHMACANIADVSSAEALQKGDVALYRRFRIMMRQHLNDGISAAKRHPRAWRDVSRSLTAMLKRAVAASREAERARNPSDSQRLLKKLKALDANLLEIWRSASLRAGGGLTSPAQAAYVTASAIAKGSE